MLTLLTQLSILRSVYFWQICVDLNKQNTGLHLISHKQKSHLGCLVVKIGRTEEINGNDPRIRRDKDKVCNFCVTTVILTVFKTVFWTILLSSIGQVNKTAQNWLSQCWAGRDGRPRWSKYWPKLHKRWRQCLHLTMIGRFTSQCNNACLSCSLDQYDWLRSLSMG